MGREIKHVPLDFNWPLNQVWHGYKNPWYQFCHDCKDCGGSGLNRATKQLQDAWYSFGSYERHAGWCYRITQDEVDALIEKGRLYDFTHTVVPGKGWQEKDPPYHPTAAEVNEWAKHGFGHDAINQWICVKARAERMGVYGHCDICKGEGSIWDDPKYKQSYEAWEKSEPPTGEGWQLWETVSEGSPISPVLPSKDAFVQWLVDEGYSYLAATQFCETEWAPSMIMVNGEIHRDIESAALP